MYNYLENGKFENPYNPMPKIISHYEREQTEFRNVYGVYKMDLMEKF